MNLFISGLAKISRSAMELHALKLRSVKRRINTQPG